MNARVGTITLFLLSLVLAACGSAQDATGESPAAVSDVPPPTFDASELTQLAEGGFATPVTPEAGFKQLEGEVGGLTLTYPQGWYLADGVSGQLAVLQSFPPEQAGTEGIPDGESKCDFLIRSELNSVQSGVDAVVADDSLELIEQREQTNEGGLTVVVVEVDSQRVGPMNIAFASYDGQVIQLSCFGSLDAFATMSASLRPVE